MAELDQLKQKYQSALAAIQQKGVRLAHMHVQDGKLFLQGEAPTNKPTRSGTRFKAVDPSYSDLTLDLTVNSALASATAIRHRQAVVCRLTPSSPATPYRKLRSRLR